MSTFLILINNAPLMAPYHQSLGNGLVKNGHSVVYAYTDKLPALTYDILLKDGKDYVFSEYFQQNFHKTDIPAKYTEINLWGVFFSDYDRNIVHYDFKDNDYQYYHSLMANLVNFFDHIITENKVDYFIYENVSNSFAYACFEVAKRNKARFLGYCVARLPGRFEIQEEVLNMVGKFGEAYKKETFEDISEEISNEILAYISKYDSTIPSYHSLEHPLSYKYSLLKKYLNNNKMRMFYNAVRFRFKHPEELKYCYQIYNPVKTYSKLLWRQLKRKTKAGLSTGMFDKTDIHEKYFLFPLQMKPESSTSVWARHFVDEISVIRNIAFNLPFGTKLYVKEHFVNLGNLPLSTYRELKKIPNVKLVHPLEPNTPLIKNAKGLITLTSTMGFEALVMGKTVVAFGDIFYQHHPKCISLRSFENLFHVLNNIRQDEKTDIEETKRFLAAYYKCTYPGNVNFVSYPEFDPERFTSSVINAIEKMIKHEVHED